MNNKLHSFTNMNDNKDNFLELIIQVYDIEGKKKVTDCHEEDCTEAKVKLYCNFNAP